MRVGRDGTLCYNSRLVSVGSESGLPSGGWRGERDMNWADWTIIAILGVSCLISLWRGFIKEALSLASWLLAAFIAIVFHQRLALVYGQWIDTPSVALLLAFITLFIGTLVVGALLSHLLGSLVAASGLGGVDRLLGVAFGITRGLLLVLALVILLPLALPVKQDRWWAESRLIPHFEVMEVWTRDTFGQLMQWSGGLLQNARSAQLQ